MLKNSCKGNLISRHIPESAVTGQPNDQQPQIQQGTLFIGVGQQEPHAGHSHSSCAEVKNKWSYKSTPPYSFMANTVTTRPLIFTNTTCSVDPFILLLNTEGVARSFGR
jgi:hypothetical protein